MMALVLSANAAFQIQEVPSHIRGTCGRKHGFICALSHEKHCRREGKKLFSDPQQSASSPLPYPYQHRPIPVMPSRVFQELALSHLELLVSSLSSTQRPGSSKVKTTALYLPQENAITGQLEFTPAILYPMRDRVFIASDADSGVAPTLPPTLTKLPGFSHAKALMPDYPMVSSSFESSDQGGDRGSVGVVEEVLCDPQRVGSCALSVPLFSGLQTLGVLLVSPADLPADPAQSVWIEEDRERVSLAARSLSLALSMDQENQAMVDQNQQIAQALSDSMHQLKNPIQALRTYSKLLQQQIANEEDYDSSLSNLQTSAPSQYRLVQLADHLMVQSDRLTQRLLPVDSVVEQLASSSTRRNNLLLLPATAQSTKGENALALYATSSAQWPTPLSPWEQHQRHGLFDEGEVLLAPTTNATGDDLSRIRESIASRTRNENGIPQDYAMSGDFELEMAFLPDVLESVFDTFSAMAEERRIRFVVRYEKDDLSGVTIHPESVEEVVSNILDNAFKYVMLRETDLRNHSPEVRVFVLSNAEGEGAGVTLVVTDNGPGIPKEDAIEGHVFRRGYRVPSTKYRAEGQGLGLSIAKKLVQAMDGELRVVFDGSNRKGGFELLDGATLELKLWRRASPRQNST